MDRLRTVFGLLLLFLGGSAVLFGVQHLLSGVLGLSFRVHFLIFFVTFIGVATVLVLFALGKREVLGFAFLGFVVFKIFAVGYIALAEKGFREHILLYFMLYWLYLLAEVLILIRLIKKSDKNHTKNFTQDLRK